MDLVCVGPMARFVEDIRLVLPVICGPAWVDPCAGPATLLDPGAVEFRGLRVGVFADDPRLGVTCGTLGALAGAGQALADCGAMVADVVAPWDKDPTELFFACVGADGGVQIRTDLAAAKGRHHPLMADLLDSIGTDAPSASEWFAVQRRAYAIRAAVRALAREVDVLLCPVAAGPAPRHGEPPGGLPLEHYAEFRGFDYVHPIALGGLPAASVPFGTEDGLPIGAQVSAVPYREDLVLAVADALEAAR